MDYVKDFGNYLRELRHKQGLTIKSLSSLSGVSTPYLSQLENGKRGIPSKDILKKLSDQLNVNYQKLLERAGYLKYRDLRNNLVHAGLDEFLETNNIEEFIQQTIVYLLEIIKGQLAEGNITKEKKEKLINILNPSALNVCLKKEFDLETLQKHLLVNTNQKRQIFILLTLIDFLQNSNSEDDKYNTNKPKNTPVMENTYLRERSVSYRVKESGISPSDRYKVLKRDNSTCQICGAKAPDSKIVIDHIEPLSKHENDTLENLQAICLECLKGKYA
ncbi:transcriptional regulator with XRE-family HTH domain [Neobacillus niacini]|uniref:helix-turn-helix domain-containing protein n=1 Tax=Neobacillus niacini TaxID=86668 RepID=UPI002861B463|nr:helix-turn-helix domain-containing protein [Neobacillus niacini]MDR7079738.1 transcriptional regulator with XRE-family HTH domain [Neobacillus niacini]